MLRHTCLILCPPHWLAGCSAVCGPQSLWDPPMMGAVSQLLTHTQPDPSVWFWVGTRTIPKFGDFLPKWQGVLVNHNVLNSSLVSLMWEREENLRSNWGSTHQFVTETWNYGFSRLLVYSCICFPTHLPHLFSFDSFPASFLHTSSPFKPDYVPLFLLTLL